MSSFSSNTKMNLNELENKMFNIHQNMITCKISNYYINELFKTIDEKASENVNVYLYMLKEGEKHLKEELKNNILEFDKLMSDLSDEDLKEHVEECIWFLNEQCVPDAVVDWREIPRPTPLYWMWVLMKKSPQGYGINEFINGDCPEEFYVHPIREHEKVELYGSILNPEKAREAIGFIFNDIKHDWRKRDFRTEEEVQDDNKREIEFLYGDEDDESYKESLIMYDRMKARMDERSEDDKKRKEDYRVNWINCDRASNNINLSVDILKDIFKDNYKEKYEIGQILGRITKSKSEDYNNMLKKYTNEEYAWYGGFDSYKEQIKEEELSSLIARGCGDSNNDKDDGYEDFGPARKKKTIS